jgi:PAS domain S-box-containing protein
MTEPKPTQAESRDSDIRYRLLFEAARDGLLLLNADTLQITDSNPFMTELTGYSRAEFLGKELWQFGLFRDKEASQAAFRELKETGYLRYEDLPLQTKRGVSREVEVVSNVYREPSGEAIQCNIRDITDRKRLEEEGRLLLQSYQTARAEADTANTVKDELAEEELRHSEEKYRLLLDGVHDYAIFMLDAHGHVVSWHAGAERLKGYTADQIIGCHFSCFFPQEEIERGRPGEVLAITAANGRHEELGMRVRKDGTQFLANVTLTALRAADGNLQGFSEFSHDLSESKESEERYRGLLEAAPDAMVVVNPVGEIILLNVQAEKQFGYSRDELVGQKVTNIIPEGFAERIIADGLRSAADALAQQIGTGIELTGGGKMAANFPLKLC